MAPSDDILTDVPGTVYLVDSKCTSVPADKKYANYLASGNLNAAHAGRDILLIPQPSSSQADPLVSMPYIRPHPHISLSLTPQNWPKYKKYWSLLLISAYACIMSFGENNWGAAWTTISYETGVTLENMNGGSALNYLLLGFFNIIWIPLAMKFGRKIVFIVSLVFILAGGIWGGFFEGTVQYYFMLALTGVGTAAYQALIQLTVCFLLLDPLEFVCMLMKKKKKKDIRHVLCPRTWPDAGHLHLLPAVRVHSRADSGGIHSRRHWMAMEPADCCNYSCMYSYFSSHHAADTSIGSSDIALHFHL